MQEITMYCDGACLGNPGPGGYAALLMLNNDVSREKVVSGFELKTTNNRMELRAVIEGLKALKRPCQVTIFCDSLYVIKGMTEWMPNWLSSGFRNAKKKSIANVELWQELLLASQNHSVSWRWVRGHAGHELNERVDEIAKEQAGFALHQMSLGKI